MIKFILNSLAGIILITICHPLGAQEMPKNPPPMKLNAALPSNLFVELARIINPGVVNISTSTVLNAQRDPFFEMFERFYGVPMMPRPEGRRPQQTALGSGFIIRDDGLIVTNAHVVRGADIINVQLTEGSEKSYEAKLIGSDERSDIALIKIKSPNKLNPIALGNSKDVQVGEWVAAFGNPFGHGHTMTKGIVSSVGRQLEEINKFPLIQTDASINPGNSGGPLVDSRGFVIGVNSAIDARAQGIGFAIPIDEVKKIIPDLESRGSIRKGYIGVGLGEIDPRAAEAYNLRGAVIIQVEPRGPASKAKLKSYDVIVEFNGKKIKNSTDLMDAVADAPIGATVSLKYMRQDGEEFKAKETKISILERPSDKNLAKRDLPETKNSKALPHNIGLKVADLDANLREQMGLSEELEKPVVVGVDPNSIAAFVGIQTGDVILDVNRKSVSRADEVLKAIIPGKENSFRLARGKRILVISFNIK